MPYRTLTPDICQTVYASERERASLANISIFNSKTGGVELSEPPLLVLQILCPVQMTIPHRLRDVIVPTKSSNVTD